MATRRSGWPHSAEGHILESFQSESGGLKNYEIVKFCEYLTNRLALTEDERMAAVGMTLKLRSPRASPEPTAQPSPPG